MAKTKTKRLDTDPYDSVFAFKLALYVIVGSLWIKVTNGAEVVVPIPIGLIIGLMFASHEHFRIDRKIGYAVLMIAMLVGFWAPFGIFVSI